MVSNLLDVAVGSNSQQIPALERFIPMKIESQIF